MSRDPEVTNQPWLVRGTVLGAWLMFAAMVLAISWGGAASRNRPFDFPNNALWNLGWVLWAGATFGVRALARRFPLERHRLAPRIALHVALGLAATTLLLTIEFLLNAALQALWPATLRANPFASFIVYKFHIYFLIYWLIVGATRAYDAYAQLQRSELTAAQLETRLAQAQVHALKMQLQPHFLFNTHHAIVSLVLQNENAAAARMLTRLSDLLRMTLRQTDRQVNPLREELAIVELYLGIQRERYRERLTVDLDVDPLALDAEVPCLLLQPLVENALRHGIDALAAGGRLQISARREDGNLILSVRDNGPGLPTGFAPGRGKGVGLNNTRARLERLYGERQRCEIFPAANGGTEARVVVPFRTCAPHAREPAGEIFPG